MMLQDHAPALDRYAQRTCYSFDGRYEHLREVGTFLSLFPLLGQKQQETAAGREVRPILRKPTGCRHLTIQIVELTRPELLRIRVATVYGGLKILLRGRDILLDLR